MTTRRDHEPESVPIMRWKLLSLATAQSRRAARPLDANTALKQGLEDESLAILHPALSGWIAENHFHAADFTAAIETSEKLIKDFPSSEWNERAKLLIAQSYLRLGDDDNALGTLIWWRREHPRSRKMRGWLTRISLNATSGSKRPPVPIASSLHVETLKLRVTGLSASNESQSALCAGATTRILLWSSSRHEKRRFEFQSYFDSETLMG